MCVYVCVCVCMCVFVFCFICLSFCARKIEIKFFEKSIFLSSLSVVLFYPFSSRPTTLQSLKESSKSAHKLLRNI